MIVLAKGFDTGLLFQAAIVFVLFVLPVLRGIVQSRQKQRDLRERRRRGEVKEPPDRKAERKGLSDWERLLRGEQVEQGRPKRPVLLEQLFPELTEEKPPPPPAAPKPPPAPARERASDPSAGFGLEGSLREQEPRPAFDVVFAALGETDLTTLDDDRPPPRARRPRTRARMRVDWRRAVALAEVLGTPVSMREGGSWSGAPRRL